MCGECSQRLGHTRFAPAHGLCAFPVYTAQGPGCSAVELSKEGPGLHALPRSKPLRFRFSGTTQRHRLGWACVLCSSQIWAAQATKFLASTLSGGAVSLTTSPAPAAWVLGAQRKRCLRCAVCFLWEADLWLKPFWWMSTIQGPRKTWLAPGSTLALWYRMLSPGPRLPLSSSGCCLPASLPPARNGPVCSRLALLWYLLSPLFCEWAGSALD